MAETRRGVVLRLSAEGAEQVKQALRALGKDGEDSLRRLERTSKTVPPHLKLIDTASKDVQRSLDGLATRGGAATRTLATLGPVGLAAAAGLGAITLGIGAALRIAREANEEFDAMAKRIRDLGIDSDLYQGLRFIGLQEGVSGEQFDQALQTAQLRFGELELGVGRAIVQLKRYDAVLLDNVRNATTFDDRLQLVADAIAAEEDATRRATLTKLFFGSANVEVARILKSGSQAFDGFIASAREMGVLIDRELLEKQETLNDRLAVAAEIVDKNLKRAFVDLVPVVVWAAESIAAVARGISAVIDASRDLEARTTAGLEREYLMNQRTLDQMRAAQSRPGSDSPFAWWGGDPHSGGQQAEMDRLIARNAAIEAELQLRSAEEQAGGGGGPERPPPPALPDAAADRIRQVIEGLKFQEDQLARTGAEQAAYNALVQAGIDENHALAPAVMGAAQALYAKQQAVKADTEALRENERQVQANRQAFEGMLKPFLQDLAAAKSGTEILGNLLGRVGSMLIDSGASAISSLLFPTGSGPASWASAFFGAPRAGGGSAFPGHLYPVGEKGIEYFAPSVPGTVIPNGALGGGTVVNIINNAGVEISQQRRSAGDLEIVDVMINRRIAEYDSMLPDRVAHIAANPRER